MDNLFSVEAQCRSVNTKGINQVKIVMDSQENLTDGQLATIAKWHGKHGHLLFLQETPDAVAEQIAQLPKLTADEFGVTPSQRLHKKIYKLYMTYKDRGVEVPDAFNQFYEAKMQKIMDMIDEKCT